MNICFVTHEYPPNILGGAGTYANLLRKGLEAINVNVHVIAYGPKNEYKKNITRLNIPNIEYWRRPFFSYYTNRTIEYLDKYHNFDLVHYNEPHIILQRPNKSIVTTFHSNRIKNLLENLFTYKIQNVRAHKPLLRGIFGSIGDIITANKSDRVICPSANLKELVHKYCFIDNELIQVIPNGINYFKYQEKFTECTLLENNSLYEDNYILYMGRLEPMKGIEYLIYAFKNIKKRHPKIKLVIAGSGFYENTLRAIAKSVQDVIFLGFISNENDIISLYSNCLAVVLPSFSEVFPMTILEAMASGKPVIASDVGGISDMIRNQENGFIIKPGNSLDIEKSINILIENPDLREEIGKRNRIRIENNYTIEHMAKATLDLYRDILKS